MTDLFENPMGLDGFEFVEFTAPTKGILEAVFAAMGFTHVANHKSKDVALWRQGDINFIANYTIDSPSFYYGQEHGPSACGMAFRVTNSQKAYQLAIDNGAQPIDMQTGAMELKLPAMKPVSLCTIKTLGCWPRLCFHKSTCMPTMAELYLNWLLETISEEQSR